jgi:LysM repeat protein
VARLYGTTVGDLILTNQLAPPYKLTLGQRLVVPGAYGTAAATQPAAAAQTVAAQPAPIQAAHVVRSGDTVYSIARRYKVDMADLVRLNGIPASYQISPGQRLKLPGQAAAVAGLPAANGTKLSSAAAAPQPVAQATPAAWTQSSQASVVMMPPPEITGPIPEPPARAGSKFLWPVEGKLLKNYGRAGSTTTASTSRPPAAARSAPRTTAWSPMWATSCAASATCC